MEAPTRQRIELLLAEAAADQRCYPAANATERRQLHRAIAAGIALRPYPGVFVSPEHWKSLDDAQRTLHLMRAVHTLHPDTVFAGPSAALAHGLSIGNHVLRPLCVATSRTAHAASNKQIRRIVVTGDTPVEKQGALVSSFVRAVFDCLRLMPFADALVVADSALRDKGITQERLAMNLVGLCGHRPGIRRALDIVRLSDGRAESGGESIARAQMILYGFAIPDLQRVIPDPVEPGKAHRVDFAWDLADGTLVIGELDGREKYENPAMTSGRDIESVLLAERRRESHLTLGGRQVRIMRFSYREALDNRYFPQLLDSYGVPHVTYVPEVARKLVSHALGRAS